MTQHRLNQATTNKVKTLNGKLAKAGIRSRIHAYTTSNNTSHTNTVFNLSTRDFTNIELTALSKGLKYGIKPKNVDSIDIRSRFILLKDSLESLQPRTNDMGNAELDPKNACFSQLETMAEEYV